MVAVVAKPGNKTNTWLLGNTMGSNSTPKMKPRQWQPREMIILGPIQWSIWFKCGGAKKKLFFIGCENCIAVDCDCTKMFCFFSSIMKYCQRNLTKQVSLPFFDWQTLAFPCIIENFYVPSIVERELDDHSEWSGFLCMRLLLLLLPVIWDDHMALYDVITASVKQ